MGDSKHLCALTITMSLVLQLETSFLINEVSIARKCLYSFNRAFVEEGLSLKAEGRLICWGCKHLSVNEGCGSGISQNQCSRKLCSSCHLCCRQAFLYAVAHSKVLAFIWALVSYQINEGGWQQFSSLECFSENAFGLTLCVSDTVNWRLRSCMPQ
jgi:hypothetical protein